MAFSMSLSDQVLLVSVGYLCNTINVICMYSMVAFLSKFVLLHKLALSCRHTHRTCCDTFVFAIVCTHTLVHVHISTVSHANTHTHTHTLTHTHTHTHSHTHTHTHTHTQVLRLLDAMGLEQYSPTFQQQQINGDILADCDDEILRTELQITSRLHRMRLLRVISGQYSVIDIMSGKDGYVMMLRPNAC